MPPSHHFWYLTAFIYRYLLYENVLLIRMPRYRTLLSNRIQPSSVLLFISLAALIRAPSLLRTYPSQSPTTIVSYCVRYFIRPRRPGRSPGLLSNAYGRRIQPTQYYFGMMRPIFVEIICQTWFQYVPLTRTYPSHPTNIWCVRSLAMLLNSIRQIEDGFSKIRIPESSLSTIYTRLHIW
jgi:hypothetical protein